MRFHERGLGLAVLALATVGLFAAPLVAQMGQHSGGQHMQGQTPGAMSASMMATDQMMRNIDTMMTNASSMMRDLSTMQAGMTGSAQHGQTMSSMEGMLDQMRQLHGSLNDMMKDPALHNSGDAMKAFQQACRNLEQMTSAFQSMTKNMNKAMQGMSHGPKP